MNINRLKATALVLPFALFTHFASADISAEQQGYNIALALDSRDVGFGDSSAKLAMILKNGHGSETVRELNIKVLEDAADGDKSLIEFSFPADIKGTTLLTHPQQTRSDDQWLYLPAVNRTKRISSSNKSGSFMGSEFSFEDMTNKDLEDYSYSFITTEPCSEPLNDDKTSQCDVIERFPKDKHSGYSKQKMWVEKTENKIYKIEYYDRKNTLLKVFSASGFKLYDDKYWRPSKAEMHNLQTNKTTVLEYSAIEFSSGLSDREFHRSSLGE